MLFALASCSSSTATRDISSPLITRSTSVDAVHSACRDVIEEGPLPAWADEARVGLARYVISDDQTALGVLWAEPMLAGEPGPDRPSNKILWIVNRPRKGSDLVVTAVPIGSPGNPLELTFEADSGPGEIYPTEIDVPTPGCWRMELQWAGHAAVVTVPYEGQA